jgi:hypothetical protein
MQEKYYGLYCEQCGVWATRGDGRIIYYPAPEIAQAQINNQAVPLEKHLWQPQEFVTEQQIGRQGTEICPYSLDKNWEYKNLDDLNPEKI